MTKLTQQEINKKIKAERYFSTGKTCICVLTLENGYEIVGYSGVIDPREYNEEIGRDVSRKKAAAQIWQLEGYLRQEELHQ